MHLLDMSPKFDNGNVVFSQVFYKGRVYNCEPVFFLPVDRNLFVKNVYFGSFAGDVSFRSSSGSFTVSSHKNFLFDMSDFILESEFFPFLGYQLVPFNGRV